MGDYVIVASRARVEGDTIIVDFEPEIANNLTTEEAVRRASDMVAALDCPTGSDSVEAIIYKVDYAECTFDATGLWRPSKAPPTTA